MRQLAAAFYQASLLAVSSFCTDNVEQHASKLATRQSGSKLPHSKALPAGNIFRAKRDEGGGTCPDLIGTPPSGPSADR